MITSAVQCPEAGPLDYERLWSVSHWFALYTRSRHEKLANQELQKKGFETFLPLRQVLRHWSDRKKIIEDPLFKGYLFVHTPLRERWNILNTAGVVNFVGNPSRKAVTIPESELSSVRRFVENDIEIDPFPYLKKGMRVYIKSGPFKGIEGFIVRKDQQCRLVISIDVLMQSVSIEIDQACIECID